MAKTGLVMEGGAMRGMFTAGVCDVFLEQGILFDGAIGVSAGATFGCNYKSRQIGRAIRYNKRFAGDKRFCSFWSLRKTGDLYGADFCYNKIPNELDPYDYQTYRNNPMPLCSRIVEVDGYKLLDGGMTDSIPLKYFEDSGYEKNVVILTQEKEYVKKPNRLMPLISISLKKYPALVKAMANRHEVYNREKDYVFKAESEGRTLVICPQKSLGISRTEKDPEKLEYCYLEGRRIALQRLEEIQNFLAK